MQEKILWGIGTLMAGGLTTGSWMLQSRPEAHKSKKAPTQPTYPVSVHGYIFVHKSKVLREQLLQSGEPLVDNELIAR